MRARSLLPALLAACVATGTVRAAETAAVPDPAALAPAVTVVPAETREVVERAMVTGTLVPRDEILVAPEIEGTRITELLVEEGARVEKGQPLARLSVEMIVTQEAANAAALARAEAAIVQARSQIVQAEAAQVEADLALARSRSLVTTGNATAAVLEQRVSAAQGAAGRLAAARGGLQLAEADRATARAQGAEIALRRARTDIRAPEGGIVSRRTARVGATASALGEPMFRLIARGEIELEGEIPEVSMPGLKVGDPVVLDGEGGRTLRGQVRRIDPEVDRMTRLGRARIALAPDPSLRIGAFARGKVEVARRRGVTVPLSAVLYAADGAASVFVVKDDRAEVRRIEPGLAADGVLEIRSGVAAGEAVVARASSFLRDGDRVRAVQPAQADAAPAR
ncbi:efflux RND transporter periplasmic adaptor subunit [Methylobacterium adhaesivum]|uniref:Efflux RND transporter periplasmic adaptor subunit n=1 Tax=Methylobacterium adhaesivum TaxID=333297 RepID=A0ABT8BGD7_9HYPH|nr:efflux RND transporter periplasmic adaptor subunit [Methylobacterium adhaesivum]MDN3590830.1 efflux RND transporter periplasmic adaptor subunit [Methylobacterium adhaesivum]